MVAAQVAGCRAARCSCVTWLLGGRVLVGRVEVRDDATTPPQHALVLCRWDEPSRTCVAHVFDAGGGHSTYRVSTDGNEVRLEGGGGTVTGRLDPSTGELGYAWTVTDDGDATPSQPGPPGTAPSSSGTRRRRADPPHGIRPSGEAGRRRRP